MEVGFSLGSNLGDRLQHLTVARDRLREILQSGRVEQSAVYETEPVDVPPEFRQLAFLNAFIVLETEAGPRACLEACKRVETERGRVRSGRNSPRPVDVDIIYADFMELAETDLEIPHPRWNERRFILRPLADIRPQLVLPGSENNVAKLLEDLDDDGRVELYRSDW